MKKFVSVFGSGLLLLKLFCFNLEAKTEDNNNISKLSDSNLAVNSGPNKPSFVRPEVSFCEFLVSYKFESLNLKKEINNEFINLLKENINKLNIEVSNLKKENKILKQKLKKSSFFKLNDELRKIENNEKTIKIKKDELKLKEDKLNKVIKKQKEIQNKIDLFG
ncbi:MAG: hypothetical protein RsTaC01_0755 [Candidatus Paraimprobicoccus trichonymphae]|uniref:Uncharacterized protein n=1 Tax=Candidatus Paraimprobicoccus trichonymphae TaxID=3033793 RepID=A0AA48IHH5_9FIRM|nr:MAG: hypothetical protein RsTaC01_0755 [Candidatus Paraimprobicoccus trichonymphae]